MLCMPSDTEIWYNADRNKNKLNILDKNLKRTDRNSDLFVY